MKLTLIPAQYLEQSIQYPELSLCRIVSQEKGLYRIISAEGDQLASVSGKFQHEAASPSDYPVVGDYVMAALNGGAAVINRVLPRKSLFLRKSAGILPVLAQQPVDEGGLAYAGGTYEGNCLSLGDIRQYLVIAVQRHGRSDKYICPDSDAGGLGGLYCGIIAKVGLGKHHYGQGTAFPRNG